jgi:hypothetical protein
MDDEKQAMIEAYAAGQRVEVINDDIRSGELATVTPEPGSGYYWINSLFADGVAWVWVVFDRENDPTVDDFKRSMMAPQWMEVSQFRGIE